MRLWRGCASAALCLCAAEALALARPAATLANTATGGDSVSCAAWGGDGGLDSAAVAAALRRSREPKLCFSLEADVSLTAPLRVPAGRALMLVSAGGTSRAVGTAAGARDHSRGPGARLHLHGLTISKRRTAQWHLLAETSWLKSAAVTTRFSGCNCVA